MRVVVRIKNEDTQVLVIRDFERANDKDVLRREKLLSAPTARRDFVEDSVGDEAIEDFSERRQGGERLGTVAPRIDDLHGRTRMLARVRRPTLPGPS